MAVVEEKRAGAKGLPEDDASAKLLSNVATHCFLIVAEESLFHRG